MLTQEGRLSTSTIRHKTNVFFSLMRGILLKNPTKITHHSGILSPLVHMPNTT
jgi:hypothetical protein